MLATKSIYKNIDEESLQFPKTIKLNQEKAVSFENLERNFFQERFQYATIFVDFLLLNLALAFWIGYTDLEITTNTTIFYWTLAFVVIANLTWFGIALFNDIYKWYEVIRPVKKVKTLLYVVSIFFAILTSLYYYLFYPVLNVNFLLPVFASFLVTSTLAHLFFRKYYKRKMPTFQYIVVGGKASNLRYLKEIFDGSYGGKSNCVGWFGNHPFELAKWLGGYSELKQFIKHNSFDKLFYIYSDLAKSEVRSIMKLCESRSIDFEIVPREIDILTEGTTAVVHDDKLAVIAPKKEPLQRLRNKLIKRAFDIVFSSLVILLIFPWLFPIIALIIKLESKGPVFFLQERTGYWNKPFNFIKFRSMAVNKDSDVKQATRNDMRVTRFGAFLRKSSLDELPQFFNVLRGDMSVVGPRPHMLKHTEEYSELIETYMVRHKVKPGITGWAQINGYRGPTETLDKMENRVKYDVHYMKTWTIIMDIRCVIMTVVNMIRGEKNAV
ncbi:MAG: exopolysaccharide biosynthesis polyprenyl glycosylphosphotransferase [Bacteroidota bacterium]